MASREVRRLDVVFKDQQATYRPGDVVAGVVYLELTSELKMKGVKLYLQGVSRVYWDEKRSYTKGSSSQVCHKNVDVYLDEAVLLCSRVENNLMPAGRYHWQFAIRLPPFIPASYEGQYGRMQYWAKVAIDQPWKKDAEITKGFMVLGTLDLNSESDAKKPIEAVGDVMTGTMCCKSGPITGQVALPKRGFVFGQHIPFTAQINNTSRKILRNVQVALLQQVTFRADKRMRKQSTILRGLTWREVTPGENAVWEDVIKGIPPVVPSRLGAGCKSIEVKYLVQLTAEPKGMGKSLEVAVEVVIGTIPLRRHDGTTPTMLSEKAGHRNSQPAQGGLNPPRSSQKNRGPSPRGRRKERH